MYVHAYVCTYVRMCVCTYVRMYVFIYSILIYVHILYTLYISCGSQSCTPHISTTLDLSQVTSPATAAATRLWGRLPTRRCSVTGLLVAQWGSMGCHRLMVSMEVSPFARSARLLALYHCTFQQLAVHSLYTVQVHSCNGCAGRSQHAAYLYLHNLSSP